MKDIFQTHTHTYIYISVKVSVVDWRVVINYYSKLKIYIYSFQSLNFNVLAQFEILKCNTNFTILYYINI